MAAGLRTAPLVLIVVAVLLTCHVLHSQEGTEDSEREPKEEQKRVPREITRLRMKLYMAMEDIELQRTYQRAMRKHNLLAVLQGECQRFYEASPEKPLGIYVYSRALDDQAREEWILKQVQNDNLLWLWLPCAQ